MSWFEGTHSETRTLNKPLDAVKSHFASLETIIANSADVETATVDGNTVHFVLEAQDHGVVKFQGNYKATFTLDGDTLTWGPEGEGNTKQSGTASFKAVDGGTEVTYTETVGIDLDIPAMMAPMVKPMISAMLGSEIKGYVKRMSDALDA
ncbi:MAG: hypothetical protein KC912_09575 [Proteobacteria bacterium]|nr:hypothetical protein [Pseudomonadota bacterium]